MKTDEVKIVSITPIPQASGKYHLLDDVFLSVANYVFLVGYESYNEIGDCIMQRFEAVGAEDLNDYGICGDFSTLGRHYELHIEAGPIFKKITNDIDSNWRNYIELAKSEGFLEENFEYWKKKVCENLKSTGVVSNDKIEAIKSITSGCTVSDLMNIFKHY